MDKTLVYFLFVFYTINNLFQKDNSMNVVLPELASYENTQLIDEKAVDYLNAYYQAKTFNHFVVNIEHILQQYPNISGIKIEPFVSQVSKEDCQFDFAFHFSYFEIKEKQEYMDCEISSLLSEIFDNFIFSIHKKYNHSLEQMNFILRNTGLELLEDKNNRFEFYQTLLLHFMRESDFIISENPIEADIIKDYTSFLNKLGKQEEMNNELLIFNEKSIHKFGFDIPGYTNVKKKMKETINNINIYRMQLKMIEIVKFFDHHECDNIYVDILSKSPCYIQKGSIIENLQVELPYSNKKKSISQCFCITKNDKYKDLFNLCNQYKATCIPVFF